MEQEALDKTQQLLDILDWFHSNGNNLRELHRQEEEKMQILLHNLQNHEFPKSPKKFVAELKSVRNKRWMISRLADIAGQLIGLSKTNPIGCIRGHLKSLDNPKQYKTTNTEYQEWSLQL